MRANTPTLSKTSSFRKNNMSINRSSSNTPQPGRAALHQARQQQQHQHQHQQQQQQQQQRKTATGIPESAATPIGGPVAAVRMTSTPSALGAALSSDLSHQEQLQKEMQELEAGVSRPVEAETFVVNLLRGAYVPPPSGESLTKRADDSSFLNSPIRKQQQRIKNTNTSLAHSRPAAAASAASPSSSSAAPAATSAALLLPDRGALTGVPDAVFDSSFENRDPPLPQQQQQQQMQMMAMQQQHQQAEQTADIPPQQHRSYYGYSTGVVRTLSKMHQSALASARSSYGVRTGDLARRHIGHLLRGVFGADKVEDMFMTVEEIEAMENQEPVHSLGDDANAAASSSTSGEKSDDDVDEDEKKKAALLGGKKEDDVIGASLGFLLGFGEADNTFANQKQKQQEKHDAAAEEDDEEDDDQQFDPDRPLTKKEQDRLLSDDGDADFENEIERVKSVVSKKTHVPTEEEKLREAETRMKKSLAREERKRKERELALEKLQKEQLERQKHPKRDPSRKRPVLTGLPDPTLLLELIVSEHAQMRERHQEEEDECFKEVLEGIEGGDRRKANSLMPLQTAASQAQDSNTASSPRKAGGGGGGGGAAAAAATSSSSTAAVSSSAFNINDGFIEHFHHKLQWALREVFDMQKTTDLVQSQYNYMVLESAKRLSALEEVMDSLASERSAHERTKEALERERENALVLYEQQQQQQQENTDDNASSEGRQQQQQRKLLTFDEQRMQRHNTTTPSPVRQWEQQQQQHQHGGGGGGGGGGSYDEHQDPSLRREFVSNSSTFRRRGRFSSLPHKHEQFVGSDKLLMQRQQEHQRKAAQQARQDDGGEQQQHHPSRRRQGSPTDDVDWEGQSARGPNSQQQQQQQQQHKRRTSSSSNSTQQKPHPASGDAENVSEKLSKSVAEDPLHLTLELAKLRRDNTDLQQQLAAVTEKTQQQLDDHYRTIVSERDSLKRALDFAKEELSIAQRVKGNESDEVQALEALLQSLRREFARVLDVVVVEKEKHMMDFLTVTAPFGSVQSEVLQLLQIQQQQEQQQSGTATSPPPNLSAAAKTSSSSSFSPSHGSASLEVLTKLTEPWSKLSTDYWKKTLKPSLSHPPTSELLGKCDDHEKTTAMHLVNLGMNTIQQLKQLAAEVTAATNDTSKRQHEAAKQLQHQKRELRRAILTKRKDDEAMVQKLAEKVDQEKQRYLNLQRQVGMVVVDETGSNASCSSSSTPAVVAASSAPSAVGSSKTASRPMSATTTQTNNNDSQSIVSSQQATPAASRPMSATGKNNAQRSERSVVETFEVAIQTSPSLLPLRPSSAFSSSAAVAVAGTAATVVTPASNGLQDEPEQQHQQQQQNTGRPPSAPPSRRSSTPVAAAVAAARAAEQDQQQQQQPDSASSSARRSSHDDDGTATAASTTVETERDHTTTADGTPAAQFSDVTHPKNATATAAASSASGQEEETRTDEIRRQEKEQEGQTTTAAAAAAATARPPTVETANAQLQTDPPELVQVPFQFQKTHDFLTGLGIENYFSSFVALRLNDEMLEYLDNADLLSAGVDVVAHRKAIYFALGKNTIEIDEALDLERKMESGESPAGSKENEPAGTTTTAAAAAASESSSAGWWEKKGTPSETVVSTAIQTEAIGKIVTRPNFCQTDPPEIDLLSGSVARGSRIAPPPPPTASPPAAGHHSSFKPLPAPGDTPPAKPAPSPTPAPAAAAGAPTSSSSSSPPQGAQLPPRAGSPAPPISSAGGSTRPAPLDADSLLSNNSASAPAAAAAATTASSSSLGRQPSSANLTRSGSMSGPRGGSKPKPKSKRAGGGKDKEVVPEKKGRGILDTLTEEDFAANYVSMGEHEVVKRKLDTAILNFNDARNRLVVSESELKESNSKMKMTSDQLRITQEKLIETSRARDVELVAARENSVELTNTKERISQLEKKLILAEEKRMQESLQAVEDLKRVQDQLEAALHSDVVDKLKAKERLFLGGSQATLQALKSLSTTLCCPCCYEPLREAVAHFPCAHVLCRKCVVAFHEEEVGCTVRLDPITNIFSVSGISYNKKSDRALSGTNALKQRRAKQHVVALLPSREFLVDAPPALSPVKSLNENESSLMTTTGHHSSSPAAGASPASPAGSASSPLLQARSASMVAASAQTTAQHLKSLKLQCAECARNAEVSGSNVSSISISGYTDAAAQQQPILVRFSLMDSVVGAFDFAMTNAQRARRSVVKDMMIVEAREDGQDETDVKNDDKKMERIERQTEEQIGDLEASASQVTVRPVVGSKVHPNALKGRLVPLVQGVELDDDDDGMLGNKPGGAVAAGSGSMSLSANASGVMMMGDGDDDSRSRLAEAAEKWS